MNALNALETTFTCAGICENSIYYTYSNITKGVPTLTCTESMINTVNNNFVIYGVISFAMAAGAFLGLMASFVTCCCYRKKYNNYDDKEEDYKAKEVQFFDV
jgi:hypothetical protein